MNAKTLGDFALATRAAGFEEILERHWAPDVELDVHAHSFETGAVVTQGELWRTCDGVTQHHIAGDSFTLAACRLRQDPVLKQKGAASSPVKNPCQRKPLAGIGSPIRGQREFSEPRRQLRHYFCWNNTSLISLLSSPLDACNVTS